jgi:hypothetical protein
MMIDIFILAQHSHFERYECCLVCLDDERYISPFVARRECLSVCVDMLISNHRCLRASRYSLS